MNAHFRSILIVLALSSTALGQTREFKTHTRGMLWETVFNTGEIGRVYDDGGAGSLPQYHAMEWPGNSAFTLGSAKYDGFYNALGAGIWIGGDTGKVGQRQYFTVGTTGGPVACGMVSTSGGNQVDVQGVYSFPISLTRDTSNYPVLPDGSVNPSYNPNEAEEVITAKWGTPIGVTITRTSRAWSFPDYDDFIIHEYELENTGENLPAGASHDTLYEMSVVFSYATSPSLVSAIRTLGVNWSPYDMYARFDLKRFLWYSQTRNGIPDPVYFSKWASTGENGGGLLAPASVGFMVLNYDHDHLAMATKTRFYVRNENGINDNDYVWDKRRIIPGVGSFVDPTARMKQPYLTRNENTNVYPSKIVDWLNGKVGRKTTPFIPGRIEAKGQLYQDTTAITPYWFGRSAPIVAQAHTQPQVKAYGFAPYILPPREKIRFAVAEVAGFGPGIASDSIFKDYGGGTGDTPIEPGPYFHPVCSWHDTLNYAYLSGEPGATSIGNTYLQQYPLPPYVNSDVVSMRQVADRAIQLYNGAAAVVKHDSLQYEPLNAPSHGRYVPLSIPCPSPKIDVQMVGTIMSQITWGTPVESITRSTPGFAGLHAPLRYYKVMHSTSPIGPWVVLDSVGVHDVRYYDAASNRYVFNDTKCNLGRTYYYVVLAVDSLGGVGGMTNMTQHHAQIPAVEKLGKVYAAPNPFVVSYFESTSPDAHKIGFFGLTHDATIQIYSYGGQLVRTIEHRGEFSTTVEWLQISRNEQWIASGVYYFTVEDKVTGEKAWNKFVIIH